MFYRAFIFISAVAFWGCDASFTDLRPAAESSVTENNEKNIDPSDVGTQNNVNNVNNVNTMNNGGDVGADAGSGDVGLVDEVVIASGSFVPGDYGGEGTAELVEVSPGTWEVRLSDDFKVGSVPGPTVVLARENSLGSTLDAARGDLELGVLETNNGGSTYPVPENPDGRRFVWIYCKPFGLEMTQAPLSDL